MINPAELRLGNYILHKTGVRILPTTVSFIHFDLFSKGQLKDSFPIALKADVLLKCGFEENKKYYQYPDAHEYVLTLPVSGNGQHSIMAYINKTGESYARVVVNELVITNHFYHVHQLQNVYFAFVGKEMELSL